MEIRPRQSEANKSSEKSRSNGTDFIKGAWRRARYPREAMQAALSNGDNAFYRLESSQGSFDKRYNINSAIDFLDTLERDEKRILNLVLKDLIREKHIRELKGNSIKVDKPVAHRMWQDILERSCDSRRKAIDSKLGRLISKLPAEVPSSETASHQSGEASSSQIQESAPPGGHDNQKQEYTVEKFNMPIFSHLTLNDLEELVREERRSNNGNSGNQDSQPVTESDIKEAATKLKDHIEKLWEYRRKEHGILACELIKGSNEETKNDLSEVREKYEELEINVPYNKLLRDLAHRQEGQTSDGNVLLASPGWAGFARQFGRTYKPETVFAKFLSMLPESTVRSPRRTAATLAALSPFGVGAAGVAVGVGIGAAGVAAGVGIGAAGVGIGTAPLWVPPALAYYYREAIKEWNKARKEKLTVIKKQKWLNRNEIQDLKSELEEKNKIIQAKEDEIVRIRKNMPNKWKKQIEMEIGDLDDKDRKVNETEDNKNLEEIKELRSIHERIKRIESLKKEISDYKRENDLTKLRKDIRKLNNKQRRLRVLFRLKGIIGVNKNSELLIPHGFF